MRAFQNLLQMIGAAAVAVSMLCLLGFIGNSIVKPIAQDYWDELHSESRPTVFAENPKWYEVTVWYQSLKPEQQESYRQSFEKARQNQRDFVRQTESGRENLR